MTDLNSAVLHDRYDVVAVVGRGGEGTLVRAVDRRHGRDVALKVRRTPDDPRDADRLLVESRTLLSLHPHPGLPLARDDFFEGDLYVLVMDWVDGVDLSIVLAEHGQPGLPPSTVLRWLAPVAEALTHLHTTDPPVIHGDVKPANIVLTQSGNVVLVDFGVSSTRGVRTRGGTPGYRAPEIAAGGAPTRAADVYGLAATAFALLTGHPPTGILPTWADLDPQRSAQLERALRRGLATDPRHRTATPGELVEELRAGWDSEPLPTGVMTFLATDVVGSTRLWQELPDTAPGLLAEHLLVVDRAVERFGGRRIGDAIQGDSTMSVFHRAGDAVRAGVDLQRALVGGRVQVHCAAHSGEAAITDGIPAGATLSRVARIRALADPGQVLVSATTERLTHADLPTDFGFIDLGPHRLDGFDQPETVLAVTAPGIAIPPDPAHPPYRGLVPYDVDDDQAFFGRDREIEICLARLADESLLAVVGPSGSGKSSLVRAGVASRLRRAGQHVAIITPGADPSRALTAALASAQPTTVLVIDQLEELFAPEIPSETAAAFLNQVVERLAVAPVIVTLRADHVGSVSAHPRFARRFEAGLHLVTPMTEPELRAVIEEPAHAAGLRLESGLVELLLRDVEGEPGALPLLSFALAETWANRDGRVLTVDGYLATGGLREAVGAAAERLYEDLPVDERAMAKTLFLRLVTPADDGEALRQRVAIESIATDDDHRRVVDVFVRSRLVTVGDAGLELAHEALVREWPRLRTWLDDDIEGQRIFRHLVVAAEAWDAMGRPESELYRGTRLAQAEEWERRAAPDLRPVERAFLETSVAGAAAAAEEAARRVRQQARQNRRLRGALVGVAVLLVAALVGGLIAFQQRNRAESSASAANAERARAEDNAAQAEANAAEADTNAAQADAERQRAETNAAAADEQRQLAEDQRRTAELDALTGDSAELRDSRLDLAALLAIEAHRLAPSASTESALFGLYTAFPGIGRAVEIEGGEVGNGEIAWLADGERIAVPDTDLAVRLIDKDSGRLVGRLESQRPSGVMWLSGSGDGHYLATATASGSHDVQEAELTVWDLRTGERRFAGVTVPIAAGSVAINADGSQVAIGGGIEARIFLFDAATGQLQREVEPIPRPEDASFRMNTVAVEYAPDGRLIVTSQAGPIRFIDPVTGDELGRVDGPKQTSEGGVIVSPDGTSMISSGADGIMRYALPSGTPLWAQPPEVPCGQGALPIAHINAVLCFTGGPTVTLDLGTGAVIPARVRAPTNTTLLSPDGETVLFFSEAGEMTPWRLDGGGLISTVLPRPDGGFASEYAAEGETLLVNTINTRPGRADADSPFVYPDASVELVDTSTGELRARIEGAVLAHPTDDPRSVVALFNDGTISRYDVAEQRRVGPSVDVGFAVQDFIISGDRLLVWSDVGLFEGLSAIVDLEAGTVEPFFDQAPGLVRMTSPTPDRVYSEVEGLLSRHDPFSGAVEEQVEGILGVAVGDQVIVALTGAGDLVTVDPTTLTADETPFAAVAPSLDTMALSENEERLLVFGNDGVAGLYDVATRTQLGTALVNDVAPRSIFISGPGWMNGAALRADGRQAAITTDNGIVVWDLDPDHWAEQACQLARRNLTRDEWETYIGDLATYRQTCPEFPVTVTPPLYRPTNPR